METRDASEIRNVVDTWMKATAAGDVDRVAGLMAEDVVFLTPENPPIRGQQAFVKGLKQLLDGHAVASRADVREVVVSGNLAYCWTDLTVTVTPRDGSPAKTRRGPTLSLFRKDGHQWLLIRDANMVVADSAELALKVDDLERELMTDGPGG